MRAIRKWVALGSARRRLLGEAAVAVLFVRLARTCLTFKALGRAAEWFGARLPSRVRSREDIAWAVGAVSRRLSWAASCLDQALAARTLLAASGQRCDLQLGVRRSAAGQFEAHAWLELDGRVLVGGGESGSFVPLTAAERVPS